MTQLLTKDDFTGSYSLALSANTQNLALLNQLIVERQDYWFKHVLGDIEFYKFKSDLSGSLPQSTKWLNFWNGSTIVIDSKTVEFVGFKSILVKLIYFDYAKWHNEKMTATGNKEQTNLESTHVYPSRKLAYAYNTASNEVGHDWNKYFRIPNERYIDYRTYYPMDYVYNNERTRGSIYNYLWYNKDVNFPDWFFTDLGQANEFGI